MNANIIDLSEYRRLKLERQQLSEQSNREMRRCEALEHVQILGQGDPSGFSHNPVICVENLNCQACGQPSQAPVHFHHKPLWF